MDYRGITCNKVLEGLQEHPLFSISPGESTVLKLNSGLREYGIRRPLNIALKIKSLIVNVYTMFSITL